MNTPPRATSHASSSHNPSTRRNQPAPERPEAREWEKIRKFSQRIRLSAENLSMERNVALLKKEQRNDGSGSKYTEPAVKAFIDEVLEHVRFSDQKGEDRLFAMEPLIPEWLAFAIGYVPPESLAG